MPSSDSGPRTTLAERFAGTWQVVVYVCGGSATVRTFPGYVTIRDAEAFADHLRVQVKRNGWTHVIRIERYGG